MSKNKHVAEFLDYYCDLKASPKYAVLVKGPWGSGKSWFVKKYIKSQSGSGRRYLYVSLYGLRSADGIEDELFRQIHPLLSSSAMRIAGKFLKGALKTTINFDFDGDGKSDGSVAASMPKEKLLDKLKVEDGSVLVFDDLERCAMPVTDVLGYINGFVEHSELKVIVVANESELLKEIDEKRRQSYKHTKEKLIGKTFEIVPEIDDAFEYFLLELRGNAARNAVLKNKYILFDVYRESGCGNLRILRNSIFEFERIFDCLSVANADNGPALKHLLAAFFALSIEIGLGDLLPNELSKLKVIFYANIFSKTSSSAEDEKIQTINKKYGNSLMQDLLLPLDLWQSIFSDGAVPAVRLNEALANSKYFDSPVQPNWVRLWHARDLTDEDFDLVLKSVLDDWRNKKYEKIGIIKHVAGALMGLSKVGLCNESKAEILMHAKVCIDYLSSERNFIKNEVEHADPFDDASWAGLGYQSENEPEFVELKTYISDAKRKAILDRYPSEAVQLLGDLASNSEEAIKKLYLINDSEKRYYDIPIFSYMDAQQFVGCAIALSPVFRRKLGVALINRYKHDNFNISLVSELDFLRQTAALLAEVILERQGRMSGYMFQLMLDNAIVPAIKKLEALPRAAC